MNFSFVCVWCGCLYIYFKHCIHLPPFMALSSWLVTLSRPSEWQSVSPLVVSVGVRERRALLLPTFPPSLPTSPPPLLTHWPQLGSSQYTGGNPYWTPPLVNIIIAAALRLHPTALSPDPAAAFAAVAAVISRPSPRHITITNI